MQHDHILVSSLLASVQFLEIHTSNLGLQTKIFDVFHIEHSSARMNFWLEISRLNLLITFENSLDPDHCLLGLQFYVLVNSHGHVESIN